MAVKLLFNALCALAVCVQMSTTKAVKPDQKEATTYKKKRNARKLQATNSTPTSKPLPRKLTGGFTDIGSLVEGMGEYLLVQDAYYKWMENWIPQGLPAVPGVSKWFSVGGESLASKFMGQCDLLVDAMGPVYFPVPQLFNDAGLCPPTAPITITPPAGFDTDVVTCATDLSPKVLSLDPFDLSICIPMHHTTFHQKDLEVDKAGMHKTFNVQVETVSIIESSFSAPVITLVIYPTGCSAMKAIISVDGAISISGVPSDFTLFINPTKAKKTELCVTAAEFTDAALSNTCTINQVTGIQFFTCTDFTMPDTCTHVANPQGACSQQIVEILSNCVTPIICPLVNDALSQYGMGIPTALTTAYQAKLPFCHAI